MGRGKFNSALFHAGTKIGMAFWNPSDASTPRFINPGQLFPQLGIFPRPIQRERERECHPEANKPFRGEHLCASEYTTLVNNSYERGWKGRWNTLLHIFHRFISNLPCVLDLPFSIGTFARQNSSLRSVPYTPFSLLPKLSTHMLKLLRGSILLSFLT